ncbi:ATP:cob(I)alamin adenosyltransferase [Hahella sp. CCB-MM4]|uniref:cob(I)yrinic acid a,c-diamide adenosyltransferase n=1 Tax=Hahella sp. (strain CCB-MM4) TaxID=1926491 RepID=UPI000B9C27CC|nr:cob(I)yrinic acid a,c-diamide adenosyltransferase [Hahella sp. CCB-MM4]OZG72504.1 ATP:cob(I)alamin adenosyltransferase [Hahella sp. CCB-MM4]
MGNRLSKIVTRTGDGGTTGLGDGQRVPKDSIRIEAIGAVDETNSSVGILIAELDSSDVLKPIFQTIQNDLFDVGGEIAMPGYQLITENHINRLENWIGDINAPLPPLKNFILPGGNRPAALCHMSRSLSRRAERVVVTLSSSEAINPELQKYLNRLSDFLFVAARTLARRNGDEEILWTKTEF